MTDSYPTLVKSPVFLSSNNEENSRCIPLSSIVGENEVNRSIYCANSNEFLDKLDLILFDCDGVLWRGEVLLPETTKVLKELRKRNKRLIFVTNNSTKSRKGFLEKMRRLGIDDKIVKDESSIFNSSYAAAEYLKSENFDSLNKIVYVIGEEGIKEELSNMNITSIGGIDDAHKEVVPVIHQKLDVDKRIGAVVVGLDRYINYYKLQYAQLCINELKALFIATNTDAAAHLTDVQEWVGAGSMVNAVIGCTHVNPIVVGKPSLNLIHLISKKYDVNLDAIAMVGDRLDTDIKFALNCGIKSVLTLTGVTSVEKLFSEKNEFFPDYFIRNLNDLV